MNTNDTLTLIQASRRAGGNAQVYTDLHAEITKKTDKVSRGQVETFAAPILNAIDGFNEPQARQLTEQSLASLREFAPEVFAEPEPEPDVEPEAEQVNTSPEGTLADIQTRLARLERIAREQRLL